MSNEILVDVASVSKKFCRSLKRSLWYGVHDMVRQVVGYRHAPDALRADEFWAVHDVSFQLRRGECLGLIGHNGAGKTTLLKILNGLIKPERGSIQIRGRLGALIALGAGFNPILTGRENIYVNGAVLGLSRRQIDDKIEDIVSFAEVGDFIDTPVQHYSSGMHVRLGFAVASTLEPDVLVVDEVLAVGDFGFRAKCYNRLEQLKGRAAIILVSHNMHDIGRSCHSCIVMHKGEAGPAMPVVQAIQHYQALNAQKTSFLRAEPGFTVTEASISPTSTAWGRQVRARISFDSPYEIASGILRIVFMDQAETVAGEWRSNVNGYELPIRKGNNVFDVTLHDVRLLSGQYFINIVLSAEAVSQYLIFSFKRQTIDIDGDVWGFCPYQMEGTVLINQGNEKTDRASSSHQNTPHPASSDVLRSN